MKPRFFSATAAGLALASTACASYFDAAPYDYVSTPFAPSADTFYFNDFNGYGVAPVGTDGGMVEWYRLPGQALVGGERGSYSMVNPRGGMYPSSLTTTMGYGGSSPSTRNSAFDPDRDSGGRGPDFGAEVVGDVEFDSRGNVLRFQRSTVGSYSGSNPTGVQFAISTAGFADIRISFDFAQSQTGNSGFFQFRASADGGATWAHSETVNPGSTNTWYDDFFFDLSSHSEFDNNPSFVFQMVAIPNPETGLWENVDGGVISGNGGGFAIDRLVLAGASAIPEPATAAALLGLLAGAGALGRRRRRC